ncbi:hypothetical protein EV128_125100 [Rhizobium azibense]|nr:hypothetical protein EV128_125100 [Rhizobium azibense]
MFQEAVIDQREGERYIGFLVEEEEWQCLQTEEGFAATGVLLGRSFKWRITDRLTGSTTEGVIPFTTDQEIMASFEQTWAMFDKSTYQPPVPEAPISPYVNHPNYGRF